MAFAIERRVREQHGGESHYIPRPDLKERNQAVRAAYDGTNRDQLCRQHGISRHTFYYILKGECP